MASKNNKNKANKGNGEKQKTTPVVPATETKEEVAAVVETPTTKSDETKTKQGKTSTEKKEVNKADKKPVTTDKADTSETVVEEVEAEVVEQKENAPEETTTQAVKKAAKTAAAVVEGSVGHLANQLGINFTKGSRLSADGMVNLLVLTDKVIERGDPSSQAIIAIQGIFSEMHAYMLIRTYVQMYDEGKRLTVKVPNNILAYAKQSLGDYGMELPEHAIVDNKDGTTTIEISEGTLEEKQANAARVENTIANANETPELNPVKWKNDADAREGILAHLRSGETNALEKVIEAIALYRKTNEPDQTKKFAWDVMDKGDVLHEIHSIFSDSGTIPLLTGGFASRVRSFIAVDQNPITAHCIVKKALPSYSDKDVASVTKQLLTMVLPKEALKDNYIWKFLIGEKTDKPNHSPYNRETFRDIIDNPDKERTPNRRILGTMYENYQSVIGNVAEEGYNLKALNQLITIANLYRSGKDNALELYTEKGYPSAAVATTKA